MKETQTKAVFKQRKRNDLLTDIYKKGRSVEYDDGYGKTVVVETFNIPEELQELRKQGEYKLCFLEVKKCWKNKDDDY